MREVPAVEVEREGRREKESERVREKRERGEGGREMDKGRE